MKQTLTGADLKAFLSEDRPTWAFDTAKRRMLWANEAALKFWHAPSLEEFLSRDYSTDSRALRERLDQTINETKNGTWSRSNWTLFPKDKPTTVVLDARSYIIGSADEAIVFRLSAKLDFATKDPDGLRMMVSARTTSVSVSLFCQKGRLISENPAARSLRTKNPDWDHAAENLFTRYGTRERANGILHAIETDNVETFEYTLPGKSPRQVLAITAKKIRDPVSGEPVAHVTEEDVTEKVNLARSLSKLNEELEERVAQRSKELEQVNERLAQAQKLETLGKLTGGIAHDFNNLLAVIQGNAELMQMTQTFEDELTSEIVSATGRGAELTRALLAYARKQPLHAKPVDLRQTLDSIQGILRRALGKDIAMSINASPDLWFAHVDEGQIKDVILNLVLNARDAMPGPGKLTFMLANNTIAADAKEQAALGLIGDFVEMSVTDTGSGMSPDVLAKAIDPFFTTKAVGKGSGLGLSMAFGMVRQTGGNMEIASQVDKGTTVKLYIPKSPEEELEAIQGTERRDVPQSKGEHIVLVEDDPAVLRFLIKSLELLDYRVTSFTSAEPAKKFLSEAQDVDLLLTDVILPGEERGPELAANARLVAPGLKVLFMSGYIDHAIEVWGDGTPLLDKPIAFEKLGTALRKALDAPSPETP
ncbi:MAG: ATP-binding protein [Pseudomonadota bacterium]